MHQFVAMLEEDERDSWFQQDGASCHTANETMDMLRGFFGNKIISKNLWPPRSPDLTSPDFFLWGYLKDRVYKGNPHSLHELKNEISHSIAEITPETLRKVSRNMRRRVELCLQENGGHFQHLL